MNGFLRQDMGARDIKVRISYGKQALHSRRNAWKGSRGPGTWDSSEAVKKHKKRDDVSSPGLILNFDFFGQV